METEGLNHPTSRCAIAYVGGERRSNEVFAFVNQHVNVDRVTYVWRSSVVRSPGSSNYEERTVLYLDIYPAHAE